jgi:hypothetical protein
MTESEPIGPRTSARLLPCLALAAAAGACGEGAPPGPLVERDTVGDTMVVRTVSGSEWGAPRTLEPEVRIGVFEGEDVYMFGRVRALAESPSGAIYVMDGQVPALRKYGPSGEYEATLGREGEGPGEYRGPDGGLAVLADGRVVLRDPRNARLQVYSATGEPLATWPIRGNFNTTNPLVVDTGGRIYTQVLLDPEAHVSDWRLGLVAYETEGGTPVDTVPAPTWDYDEPRLMAQRSSGDDTSTSISGVPFAPGSSWAFSPLGRMVGGLSTRYAIDQYLPDGQVLRIEREARPVEVTAGERANREDIARWSMRQTQPDWTWNGPSIPAEKPPFRSVYAGTDGRIWVLLHQPARPVPEDELVTSGTDGPNPRPPVRWREPVAFDVFEPDGTYLGLVRAPDGFALDPTPVFGPDRVWAVVRDAYDVQYVTRFRIAPADPSGEAG